MNIEQPGKPHQQLDTHHQHQRDYINNQEMSDVVFIIGQDRIFAHRALMGMHSKVFKSMLYNGMKESTQSEIELVDTEKQTFVYLLEYIYCGTVPKDITLPYLVSLLAAADKYDMPPLKDMCKNHVEQLLREDTVLEVLISAVMFHSWELKQKCYEIIDQTTDTIFASKNFLTLSTEVIEDILKRDQIRCEELAAFNALMAWGKHHYNQAELKENLAELVEYIRFPLIPPRDLYSVVERENVVPEALLLEAYRYASLEPELKRTIQTPRTKPRGAISELPVFDATTVQATITISADHKAVTKRGTSGHVVVLAKAGFTTGVHRWRLRTEGLVTNQWVSVGVAKMKTSRSNYVDACHWSISSAGQVYSASTIDSGNGIIVTNGHVVECVLDMHIGQLDVKNLSTGAFVALTVPVNDELFPAVGLHTLGNKVCFCDYSM